MSYITVLLHHDADDWISRVIGWVTWSRRTSHVALAWGQEVIEASSLGEPKGVRLVRLVDWMARHPGYRVKRIPHDAPAMAWEYARSQWGKPYDWRYFVGWLLRRDWQDDDAWVCQELIAWACEKAGDPLFPCGVARNSITPRDFELLPDWQD